MTINHFIEISDTDPVLAFSPMIRGLQLTFSYIDQNGPIGLTPSGAFKRKFVEWAAQAFDWPGHRPDDLYAVNKVLNEWDFSPLAELHDVTLALKIGRHFKGGFRLTPAGRTFVGHPGRLFGLLAPFYLYRVDHGRNARIERERLLGTWDIFLNVINVEAESGISSERLRHVLYGPPAPSSYYDPLAGSLYIEVLRPLSWLGLLQVVGKERGTRDNIFAKTPLWRAALHLETDKILIPNTTH